jgi:uncharacterized LabA/DUF88 family protein
VRSYNYAFIDGANLHLTYENPNGSLNLGWKVDYSKLRVYLEKKLDIAIAYWFIGKTEDNAEICEKLESYGYTMRLKEPTLYYTKEEYCPYCNKVIAPEMPRHKSDIDSFMTLQVMLDFNTYDKAVLVTSDGDFDNLIKRLLQQDKLRMVFAPCRNGCSGLLTDAAKNRIMFIDDFRDELEKLER